MFGVHGTVHNSRIQFNLSVFMSPVAARIDLMVSRIGPKWFTSNSNGVVGPIRDTIKSNVIAAGIEKIKNA